METAIRIEENKQAEGTLFVISAPSGAGKTTLCGKLLKEVSNLKLSVSYTTRQPRQGEQNDVDYTFISRQEFMDMIDKGDFAEWATVHGNLYGTSLKRLKGLNKKGYDIILDIDTRGAIQLKNSYENAVYIFILPPSMQVLEERLVNRGTDSREVIERRLDNARDEISYYQEYDYILVNDDIDRAYRELESIVLSSRLITSKIDPERIKANYKIT
jgi:guanylate kinase